MANCVFGHPIYSDPSVTYTPTFSGGSWNSSLPLTNLADRRLSKVARSSNALAASTQFEVDLKVARSVRVLALPKHTISSAGTIRVRGSNTAGVFTSPVYDTGTVTVWPSGIDAEKSAGMNLGWTHVAASAQSARYWLFEITDTANAAGYVDVGRLVIAGAWQPTINMSEGAKLGLESETDRTVTDGGSAVYNDRPRRRTMSFDIENLPSDEALASGFDMQRLAGTSGQFMFVFDPEDTTHMWRRAFLAVMKELSAVEYPYYGRGSIPYQVIEEL